MSSLEGRPNHNPDRTEKWFWCIACLEAILIIIGNGTVIYLVTSQKRLRRTGNWFILSLAFADFFVGIFIIPTFFACSRLHFTCSWDVQVLFFELFLFTSIGNLCAMTLDRYIAIIHPLRYPAVMTTKRACFAIGLAWAVPGITALAPVFWRFKDTESDAPERVFRVFVIFAFVLVPVTVLLLVYVRIIIVVRRHSRHLAILDAQLNFNIKRMATNNRGTTMKSSAKVMGTMILLFVTCWCLSTYRSLCAYFNLGQSTPLLDKLSRLLLFLNSAGNPMVYSLLKEDLRRSLIRTIGGIVNRCRRVKDGGKVGVIFSKTAH
ncbi:octopamine receptor beta-2R-like [Exaiptasia diaphana]|uniref:G-protein coupled receptors family 1 profile domain-containing protein n=1 Tax=Exaiptasia diaphana TaxID=2652724 RepID=A0A913XU36_EXADI|nr:octopamine receptor beta-2R-like [Exaiptasia diaphana]